ncbi:hypothetical protein NDU88_001382 [Pleurodeles waltl]|uniref:Uncharacterized protein n=1 Tax=Pleurodeles waltl TaxID=8319 RepID=A0AAV7LZH7_PLEWA|nr:hypothetical protein NDU88_001382 [Pleurodeles waltl]
MIRSFYADRYLKGFFVACSVYSVIPLITPTKGVQRAIRDERMRFVLGIIHFEKGTDLANARLDLFKDANLPQTFKLV